MKKFHEFLELREDPFAVKPGIPGAAFGVNQPGSAFDEPKANTGVAAGVTQNNLAQIQRALDVIIRTPIPMEDRPEAIRLQRRLRIMLGGPLKQLQLGLDDLPLIVKSLAAVLSGKLTANQSRGQVRSLLGKTVKQASQLRNRANMPTNRYNV